jgi:hypothetical protein
LGLNSKRSIRLPRMLCCSRGCIGSTKMPYFVGETAMKKTTQIFAIFARRGKA